MEQSNNVTAPTFDNADAIFDIWRQDHTGSRRAFYEFIVTPSVDRDLFIRKLNISYSFIRNVACQTLTAVS